MSDLNHRVLLAARPDGLVKEDDFTHDAQPIPERGPGEVLVRTEWLGIDATVRTWLSKAEGYIEPVGIGEVVRSSGVGTVLRSNSAASRWASSSPRSRAGRSTPSSATTRC